MGVQNILHYASDTTPVFKYFFSNNHLIFLHPEVFLLGEETGILYPHKTLFGQPRQFQLLIEARDGAGQGHLYNYATVNIQVLNVNEHKPIFILPALSNATVEITEVSLEFNYGVHNSD